jgi:hypothetical protein
MKRRRTLTAAAITIVLTLLLGAAARAEYVDESGNKMTKGEVIKALIADPKKVIYKKDKVMFDERKGTVKNAPKDE